MHEWVLQQHELPPPKLPATPPHHQDTIYLSRQQATVQSPSHPPQYYYQDGHPIAKIWPNTHGKFSFLFENIMNLQHQLDNTAGANGSSKRRKQILLIMLTKQNKWSSGTENYYIWLILKLDLQLLRKLIRFNSWE